MIFIRSDICLNLIWGLNFVIFVKFWLIVFIIWFVSLNEVNFLFKNKKVIWLLKYKSILKIKKWKLKIIECEFFIWFFFLFFFLFYL